MSATLSPVIDDPTRDYGAKVVAVEPGGVEFIPLNERHGSPRQLLWTWTSPNMEFATIGVGIIGPYYFGLNLWQSITAIIVGTLVGSLTQGILSSWGPGHGLAQMVISRSAFGFFGNFVPAGINAVVAGIGWFAVNSVSGALALHALVSSIPETMCLLIVVLVQVVVAFFGHNLVHAFERYAFPILTVIFVIACIWIFSKTSPGTTGSGHASLGDWLIMVGATFGYAAGWNPYASDYTRYMAPDTPKRPVGIYAGLGVFLSCVVLETAGAVAIGVNAKHGVDPTTMTGLLPTWLGKLVLVCICLGAVAANALNIYSGSMSFMALGIRLPTHIARGSVAILFAVIGFFVAWHGLSDVGESYENFLLIISYWIGPWLGVVMVDRLLRRGTNVDAVIVASTRQGSPDQAGAFPMIVGTVLSIWLFSNQANYVGIVPRHVSNFGDLTFEVGFLIAGGLYYLMYRLGKSRPPALGSDPLDEPALVK